MTPCGIACGGLTPCVREAAHCGPHQDHCRYVLFPEERVTPRVGGRRAADWLEERGDTVTLLQWAVHVPSGHWFLVPAGGLPVMVF